MKLAKGERVRPHITVLDALDPGSRDPVHIVWNHQALCPMACKVFEKPSRARYEADILDALAHPNIVRCLGLDTARGLPALLLMDYLEGRTLRQSLRLNRYKPMSQSNAMRLAIHICAGLEHMHGRGILHLDIKPSNIIVVHGRPVLFDFGVGRKRADWRQRMFGGSDHYMPPEQCLGEPVSPASDIFSLGLTLFELLTGKLPYPKPTRRDGHPQTSRDPFRLRAMRPRLPQALDDLVMSCLSRDASERPQHAADLVAPLHGFIDTGPPMWPAAAAARKP